MSIRSRLSVLIVLMTMPLISLAQPAPNGAQKQGGGGGGPGGGAGVMDPARFRLQILEGIKGQLAVSEEEWTKLVSK